MAQLDRYSELQNDVAFLADYSSFNKNVDFAGRMIYDDNGWKYLTLENTRECR
jgi:DNA polymerase-3 subunit epsilon